MLRIADHLQRQPDIAPFLGERRRLRLVIDRQFGVFAAFVHGRQIADAAESDELHLLHAAVVGHGPGDVLKPAPEAEVAELRLDDLVHGVDGHARQRRRRRRGELHLLRPEDAVESVVAGQGHVELVQAAQIGGRRGRVGHAEEPVEMALHALQRAGGAERGGARAEVDHGRIIQRLQLRPRLAQGVQNGRLQGRAVIRSAANFWKLIRRAANFWKVGNSWLFIFFMGNKHRAVGHG